MAKHHTQAATKHNWRYHPFQLTAWRRELILHRLEADDCLADVMQETFGWDRKTTIDAVDFLIPKIRDEGAIPAAMSTVEREVLIDCLEGSTYVAAAKGNVTDQHYGQMCALAARFERQISDWIDHDVKIPVV